MHHDDVRGKSYSYAMLVVSMNRGYASVAFLAMVVFLIALSIVLVSGMGYSPAEYGGQDEIVAQQTNTNSQIIIHQTPAQSRKNLQLHTFQVISTTPLINPTEYNIQTPAICVPTSTTETVIVIDNSGSMEGKNLEQSKIAAKYFIDTLSGNPANRIGLVLFSKNATVLQSPTSNFAALKIAVEQIPESSKTCIQCGVKAANDEIILHGQRGLPKNIILLTDGRANHVNGQSTNDTTAAQAARDEVLRGYTQSQTAFYPIGFGKNVNTKFMSEIATSTGGIYYFAPSANDLAAIFNEIAKSICS